MPKCGIYYSILLETHLYKRYVFRDAPVDDDVSSLVRRSAENAALNSAYISENMLAVAVISDHNYRI